MEKEFEINGCVSVTEDLSNNEFFYKFIDFVESNNWYFGGGIKEIVDGYYINSDGTRGEHIIDQDLKELVYKGKINEALEIYKDLTDKNTEEGKKYISELLGRKTNKTLEKLIDFLKKLEDKKIYYKLNSVREDYIMIEIAVPGERWEVEFSSEGEVVVERFKSFEEVGDEKMLEYLFENFSD